MGSLPMMIMTHPHTAGWSEIGVPTFDIMCCCCSVFFFFSFLSLVAGRRRLFLRNWTLELVGYPGKSMPPTTADLFCLFYLLCKREKNRMDDTFFFVWCVPGWLKGAPKSPYYIHTIYRVKDIGCLPGSKRFFLLLLMYFFSPFFLFYFDRNILL